MLHIALPRAPIEIFGIYRRAFFWLSTEFPSVWEDAGALTVHLPEVVARKRSALTVAVCPFLGVAPEPSSRIFFLKVSMIAVVVDFLTRAKG